jgi:hypothetical protein
MGYPAGPFRRAALAWMALAGMLFMSAGPVAIGHPSADTDCVPSVSLEHDHSAHRIGQAPEPGANHCVACHLTRSVRTAAHATALPDALPRNSGVIVHADESGRHIDTGADLTRGPPSLG